MPPTRAHAACCKHCCKQAPWPAPLPASLVAYPVQKTPPASDHHEPANQWCGGKGLDGAVSVPNGWSERWVSPFGLGKKTRPKPIRPRTRRRSRSSSWRECVWSAFRPRARVGGASDQYNNHILKMGSRACLQRGWWIPPESCSTWKFAPVRKEVATHACQGINHEATARAPKCCCCCGLSAHARTCVAARLLGLPSRAILSACHPIDRQSVDPIDDFSMGDMRTLIGPSKQQLSKPTASYA